MIKSKKGVAMKIIAMFLMFFGTVFASNTPEGFDKELYLEGEKIFEKKFIYLISSEL